MQIKLLIDGQLVAGAGAEVEVLNPATGVAIAKIREASRIFAIASPVAGLMTSTSAPAPAASWPSMRSLICMECLLVICRCPPLRGYRG